MGECKHGVNVFAGFAEGSIRADAQRDGEQTVRTVTVQLIRPAAWLDLVTPSTCPLPLGICEISSQSSDSRDTDYRKS